MLQFTCLPKQVSKWLQVLRPMFRRRHHLVFCWLLVCQAIYQEQAAVKGLARLAPRRIAEWHLRRLLTAAYWNTHLLLWWFVDEGVALLTPPADGVCYPVADRTLNGNTGPQHPWAKKWRLNEHAPYVFELPMVLMMVQ